SLSTISGLNFSTGDGAADATMVFTGTLASINTALAGLSYKPDAAFSGDATLTITSNDLGHTGAGGAMSDTDSVNITVNAVTTIGTIDSFTLMDSITDQPIMTITEGTTIDLATLPHRSLNVRANTTPRILGSVRYGYDP